MRGCVGWGSSSQPTTRTCGGGATLDLRPHASDADAEVWVASDLGAHQRPGVLRHDHVLGIGQASLTLAQTTIRPQVETALDLGTGCGIQAFHLLSHARKVIATDISARALGFTRFNLLLNHRALEIDPGNLAARVELRLGSLLEPVAGERFDLVVSNPPFVITPRIEGQDAGERFTYRDGGMPGDSLVATLVPSIPGILTPGGTAQMLANWEITAAAVPEAEPDWSAGPRSWLAGDTEAWFIQREAVSPTEYAETWLRDASQGRDAREFALQYGAYLDDFASRNVDSIGFGMVWLRRPAAGAAGLGRVFESIGYPIEQPIGPTLARDIAVADDLARRDAGRNAPGGCRGRHRGTTPASRRRAPRGDLVTPGGRFAAHRNTGHRPGRICFRLRRGSGRIIPSRSVGIADRAGGPGVLVQAS